jgi:hypothetical protein
MKTTLFTYDTPVGTFWIRPEPAGRVRLGIGRERLNTFPSATAAARAVAERTTGYPPWDGLDGSIPPPSLRRWKRPVAPRQRISRSSRCS